MMTMSMYEDNGRNISNDAEAHYEAVASQEEFYLEEVEEELRAILIFGDETSSQSEAQRSPSAKSDPRCAASLEEQITHAAEELITGDSDDSPLSEEAVAEMLIVPKLS